MSSRSNRRDSEHSHSKGKGPEKGGSSATKPASKESGSRRKNEKYKKPEDADDLTIDLRPEDQPQWELINGVWEDVKATQKMIRLIADKTHKDPQQVLDDYKVSKPDKMKSSKAHERQKKKDREDFQMQEAQDLADSVNDGLNINKRKAGPSSADKGKKVARY